MEEPRSRRRGLEPVKPPEPPEPSKHKRNSLSPSSSPPSSPSSRNVLLGKTPDGTVFEIPPTQDFLSTLFSLQASYTMFEYIIIFSTFIALFLFFSSVPSWVFMLLFIFWRLLYFFILGSLLRAQSRRKWLVRWCREHGFGPNPRRPRSGWVTFWVDEIKRKMGRHYDYDAVPVEFHAWILFRGLAEFILINDFVSYALFVISYYEPPADGHHGIMDILRYTGGILLLLFNLWVKVDAHRVVKDFAWYWGDFFLLIDSSCKRDGVFEMAPHPMYSVGYIGFYGAALIAHSYYVLFVSLATHAGQFVFLRLVETPHMNRLYGDGLDPHSLYGDRDRETIQKYFRRDLVVVKNFDFFRATDLFTAIIALYSIGSALVLGPIDHQYDWKVWVYVGQAVGWKVAHTVILGLILHLQSRSKFWSRHYIKFGDTPKEAFNNWKTIYNLTQSMIYLSFSICAFRVYEIPESFSYGYILLKHTIGVVMIVFHIYMTLSSYQAIGDVGWFYGDFFIDELRNRPTKLHYNGIYRFVNNPSSTTWSFWGLSILCSSWALMLVSTIDQICNWVFVEFVEKPHMRRLYGEQVRVDTGISRVLRKEVNSVRDGVRKLVVEKRQQISRQVDQVRKRVQKWNMGITFSDSEGDGIHEVYEYRRRQRGDRDGDDGADSDDENNGDDIGLEDSISEWLYDPDLEPSLAAEDELLATLRKDDRTKFEVGGWDGNSDDDDDDDYGDGDGDHQDHENPTDQHLTEDIVDVGALGRNWGQVANNAVESIVERVEKAVDHAKPRIQALVERTMSVASLTNRKPPSSQELVLTHSYLYSLTLEDEDPGEPLVFELGEPIVLQFTAAREYITEHDWIGIYRVTQNPAWDITTSNSSGLEMFVTGLDKDTMEGEGIQMVVDSTGRGRFGNTQVHVSENRDVAGVRTVSGTLTFTGSKIPWHTGVYEARYHHDGKFSVLAISRPFEVLTDIFPAYEADDSISTEERVNQICGVLKPYIERCLELNTSELDLDDDMLTKGELAFRAKLRSNESSPTRFMSPAAAVPSVSAPAAAMLAVAGGSLPKKWRDEVSKRIAYAIRMIFGVEFSWKVIEIAVSVRQLASRIHQARVVLSPLDSSLSNPNSDVIAGQIERKRSRVNLRDGHNLRRDGLGIKGSAAHPLPTDSRFGAPLERGRSWNEYYSVHKAKRDTPL